MNGKHFSVKDLRREYNKGKIDELKLVEQKVNSPFIDIWDLRKYCKERILLFEGEKK